MHQAPDEEPRLWLEPIDGISIAAHWTAEDGWTVVIAHHHRFAGDWSQCQKDRYDHLCTSEMLDVVTAAATELLNFASPGH